MGIKGSQKQVMKIISTKNKQFFFVKIFVKIFFFKFFFQFFFSGFSSFRQVTLGMGVFIRFMGSPDYKDLKNTMEEVNF